MAGHGSELLMIAAGAVYTYLLSFTIICLYKINLHVVFTLSLFLIG